MNGSTCSSNINCIKYDMFYIGGCMTETTPSLIWIWVISYRVLYTYTAAAAPTWGCQIKIYNWSNWCWLVGFFVSRFHQMQVCKSLKQKQQTEKFPIFVSTQALRLKNLWSSSHVHEFVATCNIACAINVHRRESLNYELKLNQGRRKLTNIQSHMKTWIFNTIMCQHKMDKLSFFV